MQKRRSINHRIIASSHHHIHIHAWTTLKIMTSKNDSKDDCTKRNHFSSPTSVAFVSPTLVPESIVLNPIVLESGANAKRSQQSSWGICPPSAKSVRTVNPIRAIVDAKIQTGEERGDGKDPISLALGDPTAAGNLAPCPAALQAVCQAVQGSGHCAGYVNACGTTAARQAVAAFHSSDRGIQSVQAASVIIANGCSGALELALTALLDDDSILLVPQPGFPLYQVICESHGAAVVPYRLKPDQEWECDLEHIHELCVQHGRAVRGILVNNPSNPTGSVFSVEHLQDLVDVCQRHHLPVVADEIYGDLTFGKTKFTPLAEVAAACGSHVPVITASGIGKQYLLPGWRVGWIVFQDNVHGSLRQVEAGAKRLAQVILGASHLAQSVVPALLNPHDVGIQKWKSELRATLETQATFLCRALSGCPGLSVVEPGGAFYAIVRIDTLQMDEAVQSDVDFSKLLLQEENVFVLPGSCFGAASVFRVVFCAPVEILEQAAQRIHQFCKRHSAAV